VRVHIRDHHMTRPGVPDYRRRHDPDRTRAGDEYVLAEDGERKRGMDGVSVGIENGCDLGIDPLAVNPDIGDREGDVFCEGPRAVDADTLGVLAEVAAAC